jgi:serine/threonine protein kinase
LAPELLVSYPTFDNRIDIWAMGLVFLELMTGTLLVDSSNPQEEIQIITDNIGEFPVKLRLHGWNYGQLLPDDPFETIPDPWNKLIQDMLIIDPDTRPSATLLLEEYFENYPSGCRIDAVLYPPYRVNLAPNYARVRETWLKSAFVASAQGEELLDYQVFFLGVDIADRFFSLYRSATDEEVEEYLPACFSLGACLLKEDTGDADEPQKCKIVDVLKFSLFRPTADVVYPHIDLDDIADMMIRVPMEV